MLEIDVVKRLRDFDLKVDLNVSKGEILMLVGNNGCGKTSLLNLIAGLINADQGEITLSGNVLYDSFNHINVLPEKRQIGYVFQNYALFPHLSVYDNVAFGLRTKKLDKSHVNRLVEQRLKEAGIWSLRDVKAHKISGGEKQRVALLRALIFQPRLLLLDEPFAALDFDKQESMREELKMVIQDYGVPSIIVTHDTRDLLCMGDRVCLMQRGKVALCGSANDVLNGRKKVSQ